MDGAHQVRQHSAEYQETENSQKDTTNKQKEYPDSGCSRTLYRNKTKDMYMNRGRNLFYHNKLAPTLIEAGKSKLFIVGHQIGDPEKN